MLENPTGYYINTTEGFQVDVECGIGDVNANFRDSSLDTRDYCGGVSMASRRELTMDVAANFPFAEISSPDVTLTTGSTDLDAVRALMEPALVGQVWTGQGDLLQGDTVEFSLDVDESRAGGTTATIIRGVYPPNDSGRAVMYTYGDSSVGWVIRDGVGVRLLASHTGTDRGGELGTLLYELANLVVGASLDEAVDATASTLDGAVVVPGQSMYIVQSGDTLHHIATLFCTDVTTLAAENGWPEGPDHALYPGDHVAVPQPGCPETSVAGTVEPTTAPTTAVGTAVTVTPEAGSLGDVAYQIRFGDTVHSIAYSFCVTPAALAAANDWFDGADHVLSPDDVIGIPATGCVRGLPTTLGSTSTSVVVAGDSAGTEAASWLSSIGIEVSDKTRVSTGLVRADFYDWSAELDAVLSSMPDGAPLVFAVGGNDGQPFLDTGDQVGSPAWVTEYANRVLKIVDLATGSGHPLVWVGVPDAADPALDAALVAVRAVTEEALAGVADVVYVDTAQILAGPDGGYAATIADLSGNQVAVRSQDGFHLTPAGQELVATRVLLALRAYDMPVLHDTIDGGAGGIYTVQAGDYLSGIAAKTGTTVDGIIAANGWLDGESHLLSLGDKIRLPAKPGCRCDVVYVGGTQSRTVLTDRRERWSLGHT